MKPGRLTVHPLAHQQSLPVLRRHGRGWQVGELGPGAGADDSAHAAAPDGDPWLDQLSDLANYGLVAPLAEVAPGALLWWTGQPAPEGILRAPPAAVPRTSPGAGPDAVVEWTAPAETTDRWRYGASAMARCMAASTGLPLVHSGLLSLAMAVDSLPAGDVHVTLAQMEARGFGGPWTTGLWRAVLLRSGLLRERRRLALGLPVRTDAAELDAAILRRFVVPAAQRALDAVHGAPCRIHVHAAGDPVHVGPDAARISIPLGSYRADDPLGENIFVLCGRRIRPGGRMAGQLRATGRRLVAWAVASAAAGAAADAPTARAGEAMLAALQMDFLHTHRAARSRHSGGSHAHS